MKLSIVIPVYNESKVLKELFSKIKNVLEKNNFSYEIVAVNDGSKDNSWEVMKRAAAEDKNIKVINFSHNFGQTAAMSAGITATSGDVIVPIDADLENDPEDIPILVKKLDEGYDVVSGWRKDRWHGEWLTRKLPSVTANWLMSTITGLHLHDYGCTLKAYKREVLADVLLYGEMHRFIPAYSHWVGAKVTELPVRYKPRAYGKSNYGISRTFRVLLDLVLIKFLTKYFNRPIHFFGGAGFVSFAAGIASGLLAVFLKFAYGMSFISTPLPTLTVFLVLIAVQMVAMGILAEMMMRIYYESQGKTVYSVKDKINF